MDSLTDIRHIMVYADNCRKLLHKTMAEHSGVFDREFQTISEYRSIRHLLAHIIGAEERWVETRLGGKVLEMNYEERAASTVQKIFEDWEHVRSRTHALVNSIDAAGLAGMIPVSLPKWGFDGDMRIDHILFHIFNHQVFHLGQISMALQHFEIDPPLFDFVFLRKAPDNL